MPAEFPKRTGENPMPGRKAEEEGEAGASHAVRSQAEPGNEDNWMFFTMTNRLILALFVLLCCATSACNNRQRTYADTLRERFANEAFTISLLKPLPDGRPVIGIEWIAEHEYPKEPLRGYRLLVRRNGRPYYYRTFGSDEFRPGFALDLAMSRAEFQPNDRLSVRLEVNLDEYFNDSLILSNPLAIELPPDTAADFSIPPQVEN